MKKTRKALFRLDAGSRIGAGHAVRCLALADTLSREGWRCAFAVNEGFGAALPFATTPDVEIVEATDASTWSAAALSSRWPAGFEIVIVDHYELDAEFERAIAGWAKRIVVVDDLLDREHTCDVLLCTAPPMGTSSDQIGAGICLFGPDYALLRDQFARARDLKLLDANDKSTPLRVHIAFGGTFQGDLVQRIVEGLALVGPPLDLVIVGEAPKATGEIATHVKITSIASTADMASEMARADFGIGACGGSAWERAALGLPSLALILVDNQIHVAQALEDAQAARVVREGASVSAEQICEAVRPLVEDADQRDAMAGRAGLLCDGLGIQRAVLAIDPERDREGHEIGLRRAALADCEAVYDWQRHPDTRRFANNPDVPSWREHQAWFADRLQEPRTLLSIVTCAGEAAGFLRLDLLRRDGRPTRLVSIAIDPVMKKRGIALAALRCARRLVPEGPLIADVHPDNAASRALFERAGFGLVDARTYVLRGEQNSPAGRQAESVA